MKVIILFLAGFVISNFSFGHEVRGFKALKQAEGEALKKMNKNKSKYDVVCHNLNRSPSSTKGAKTNEPYKLRLPKKDTKESKQTKLRREWETACSKSKAPSIENAHQTYFSQREKLWDLKNKSKIGRDYDKSIRWFYSLKNITQRDREIVDNATSRWYSLTSTQHQLVTKLWNDIYDYDNGVCGKNTTDTKVLNVYRAFKNIETRCQKVEQAYIKSTDDYEKARWDMISYERKITSKSESTTSSKSSSSGSVK